MKAPRLQLKARGNLEYSKSASANRQIWLKPTVCLEIIFFQIQLTELIIWQGFKLHLGTWNLFLNCTVIFSAFCLIKAQATLCLTWFERGKRTVLDWQTSRLTKTFFCNPIFNHDSLLQLINGDCFFEKNYSWFIRTVLVPHLWDHFVGALMVTLVVMLPFDKCILQCCHMFLNHIRHITIKWTLQLSTKLQVDRILFSFRFLFFIQWR